MAAHPHASKFAVPLLAGAALFAAGGCVHAELELEIHSDDTVDGVLTIAWDAEFVDQAASQDPPTTLAELNERFDPVFDGLPEAEVEPYDDGGYVGRTAVLTGIPLSDFDEFAGGQWGSLGIQHRDEEYVLQGYWDFTGEGSADADSEESGEIVIRVAFPGEVRDHNGELDGRTVTWRMRLGDDYELHAVAAEDGGPGWRLVLTAYALAVVNLGVAVALFWYLKRRRSQRPTVITTLRS